MKVETYYILIDGKPYEGSADFITAKHLYNTVDYYLDKEYDGSTKCLVKVGNRYDRRTWKKLLEGTIRCRIIDKKPRKGFKL